MIHYQFNQQEKADLIDVCRSDNLAKVYQAMLYFEEGPVAKQIRYADFDPSKVNAVYYKGLKVMETSALGPNILKLVKKLPRGLVSGGLNVRNAVWFRVLGNREVPIHLDEPYLPSGNRDGEHILINLGPARVTLDGVTVDTADFTHYFVFDPSTSPHGAQVSGNESCWFLQFPKV